MSRSYEESIPTPTTPAAPPPPYTEFAAGPSSSMVPFPSGIVQPGPPRFNQPMSIPPVHAGYGPTPLGANQPLLPYAYYEARGSADARARSRFISALLCAMLLWLIVAFGVTMEMLGEEGWMWRVAMRKFWEVDGVVKYWLLARVSNGAVEYASA